MARIVRHNDESVREGYIRNGGKEVKLFKSALKAFQGNNRIVMARRKHLHDFLRGRIVGRLECGCTQLEVSEELGIAQSVISSVTSLLRTSTVVGIFVGPDTHTCILQLQRYPFLTPEESNPIDRKMRGEML
ncbi:transposable element Tcb1 transposase [Trichonephila clavipes]|nr:transposable element Tcb1 transposase [Trichonephila clavipes]